jgi:large repetitive protein
VLAALDAVAGLVAADYFLAPLVPAPTAARAALVAAVMQTEIRDALTQVGDYLEVLEPQLAAVARHGFTFELDRNAAVIQPNVRTFFQVFMQNVGTQPTTYQLSTTVVGSAVLRYVRNGATITTVTLQPGQVIAGGSDGVSLEIISDTSSTLPLPFTATARAAPAAQLTRTVVGSATVRPDFLRVASVVTDPPFTDPGPAVSITARLYNALNTAQDVLASYVVLAPGGAVVFTSPTVAFTLPAQGANLASLALAPFNTTGFANGEYVVDVTITDTAGAAIPGGTGSGRLRVGLPVSASLVSTVEILSPGNQSTRSSTQSLTLSGIVPLTDPFTLIGQATTSGNSNSLAVIGNIAYVAGSEAVDIVDISNPANPVLVGSFAQGLVQPGGYSIVRDLPGDRIAVASSITVNAVSFNLRVYDVSDPLAPTLVSDTTIGQRFLSDFQAVGNTALVSTLGESFLGNVYAGPFGDVISLDLAAAGGPTLEDRLFDTGSPPGTGTTHQFGIELADADTA